jgi:uncharacterized membrane protein
MSETIVTHVSSRARPRPAAWAAENSREIVFAVGLALLGGGLALWSVAMSMIVVGGLLVWLAIPPTPPTPPG